MQHNIHRHVFLAQTDTTAGFLSKDMGVINEIKGAKHSKPLLLQIAYLGSLQKRVPIKYRNIVRKARKTSFILPNAASFRILHDIANYPCTISNREGIYGDRYNLYCHRKFMAYVGELYSSSANPTKKDFSIDFAMKSCDSIVLDNRGIFSNKSSKILKIGNKRMKKIR